LRTHHLGTLDGASAVGPVCALAGAREKYQMGRRPNWDWGERTSRSRPRPTMAHAIIHHLIPTISVHLISDRLSSNLIPFPSPSDSPSPQRLSQPAKPSQARSSPPESRPGAATPLPRPRPRARHHLGSRPNGDSVPAALAAVHLPLPRQVRPRRAQTPAALGHPLQRRRR
jgi:hypothetical protein